MQKLHIGEEHARQRADIFACDRLPSLSRAYVQKLFADGRIKINNNTEKPGYRLKLNDEMQIDFDPDKEVKIEDIDIPIIYQDENVVVVNKPIGVISHSRGKYWYEPSVASFVRQITQQEGDRAGIVHRLDRATSGVMICSKNSDTLKLLQRQFSDRSVKKTYLAIVSGTPKEKEAVIDMPIERNPKKPQTFRVGAQGKSATTQYKVVSECGKYSLLELRPATGRTHQLRVHLDEIGHPIVGDELYDGPVADRLMLHAAALEVTIPDAKNIIFEAPTPDRFVEVMKDCS